MGFRKINCLTHLSENHCIYSHIELDVGRTLVRPLHCYLDHSKLRLYLHLKDFPSCIPARATAKDYYHDGSIQAKEAMINEHKDKSIISSFGQVIHCIGQPQQQPGHSLIQLSPSADQHWIHTHWRALGRCSEPESVCRKKVKYWIFQHSIESCAIVRRQLASFLQHML